MDCAALSDRLPWPNGGRNDKNGNRSPTFRHELETPEMASSCRQISAGMGKVKDVVILTSTRVRILDIDVSRQPVVMKFNSFSATFAQRTKNTEAWLRVRKRFRSSRVGAGFLGSHLTDRLRAEGHRVIAIDNLITGNLANIEHLGGNENYRFIKRTVYGCSWLSVFARFTHAIAAIALLLWPGQLSAASASSARGIQGEALTESQMKGAILSTTHPDYPIEARRARTTGSGVFEMRIDPKTGRVKGVLVVQSTGSQILDWAVVRAFSRWRFKPGVVTAARSPVIFTTTGHP
jgi:TonB family protein